MMGARSMGRHLLINVIEVSRVVASSDVSASLLLVGWCPSLLPDWPVSSDHRMVGTHQVLCPHLTCRGLWRVSVTLLLEG